MKKGTKLLVFGILGLVLASMFLGVVSAQTIGTDLLNSIQSGGSSFIQNLTQGTWFAQFLLFLLITLIVFAVSEFMPFLEEKSWLSFGISAIIGFLAAAYLKNEEVYTILLSYSAMGIALTSIIPFLVIAVIAKKLHEKGYTLFSKSIWIVFAVVLSIKWLVSTTAELGNFGKYAYPITLALVILMILFENWIYFKMFKSVLKGEVSTANVRYVAHITAKMEKILDEMDSASPEIKKRLEAEYDELKKKLDKANAK